MSQLLKGKPVAAELLQKTIELVDSLSVPPEIALVRVGADPAAKGYQRSASKLLKRVGINVKPVIFDEQITMNEFKGQIEKLNADDKVNAVLLLEPLPHSLALTDVQDLLEPNKDVDGVTRTNLGRSLSPRKDDLVPLTAAAVMELLDFYDINLSGKHVTLVGDSLTVGRPLANLLLTQDATLTVCDSQTPNVGQFTRVSDIVIMAVGKPALLTAEMVNDKAVVIDVGTNYDQEGKLVGDVAPEVSNKVQALTPVPGGIGALTTNLLAYRTAKIAAKFG